jgi:hypothetical protein
LLEPSAQGWFSLIIPVEPAGPELAVFDVAIDYRISGMTPVRARLDMQWELGLHGCEKRVEQQPSRGRIVAGAAQWVTVFEARDARPWHVPVEMPG